MSTYRYSIIPADETKPIEPKDIDLPSRPNLAEIRAIVLPVLQAVRAKAHLEHVAVLYKGNRASMFVDDEGALFDLPVNIRATEIYHAASRSVGRDVSDAPLIYGDVIQFEMNVWH